jgi:hypothetical protein
MTIRYHDCGWPVRVEEMRHGSHVVRFYDYDEKGANRRISVCGRCGEHLSTDALCASPLEAARTLHAWSLAWPQVRHQLNQLVAEQLARDSEFYAYHAQRTITDFEQALNNVAQFAADVARVNVEEPS